MYTQSVLQGTWHVSRKFTFYDTLAGWTLFDLGIHMLNDLLEHDINPGATLVDARDILQIGATLIAEFYRDNGHCLAGTTVLHRLATALLTFILAARIGDG